MIMEPPNLGTRELWPESWADLSFPALLYALLQNTRPIKYIVQTKKWHHEKFQLKLDGLIFNDGLLLLACFARPLTFYVKLLVK